MLPEEDKNMSSAELKDMKRKICAEGSKINEPAIKKGKKKARINECANILAHVFNTIIGKNKKENMEMLIKASEHSNDDTCKENFHDLDKNAVDDALMKKVNKTYVS